MRIMLDMNVLISAILFRSESLSRLIVKVAGNPLFEIRDDKDYMVLYTAILADVDILITGDKDFKDIKIERPEILTPKKFFEKY